MAAIETNRADGEAAKAAGTLAPKPTASSNPPTIGPRLDPYPATPNPYIRTPLPAISTQQPDQQRNWQAGSVPQDRLIGVPATANPVVSAQTITNIVRVGGTTTGGGIVLETNNQQNAVQNLLNIIAGPNISASSDAHGGVTISGVASTSIPEWPLPNTAVAYMARAIVGATALQVIGDSATNGSSAGSGAVAAGTSATATDGVNVQISTGGTSNSAFGFNSAGTNSIFWYGRSLQYQARGRFVSGGQIAAGNVYLGFSNQTAVNLRPPGVSGSIVAISTNFGTVIGTIFNGAIQNSVNLSFTMDTNTHSYAVIMDDVHNTTTFFIDGNNVGSLSGVNPSGVGCWPTVSILNKTSGGATCQFNLEYFYAQQSF